MKNLSKILLVFFGILFFIPSVNALNASYDDATYNLYVCSSESCSDRTSLGYKDLNTQRVLSGTSKQFVESFYLQIFGSNTNKFVAGNYYTLDITLSFNPRSAYINLNHWEYLFQGSESSSGSSSSSDFFDNSTFIYSQFVDNNPYQFLLRVTFTPTTDLKYLLLKVSFPVGSYVDFSDFSGYPYKINYFNAYGLKITYEESVESIISGKLDGLTNQQQQTNNKLDDLNDTITSDDVRDSTNQANSFFSGFQTDTFGLTSVITAPLNLISSITSSSCSPLGLHVPFVNQTLNLPCFSSIYQTYFGDFLEIYQTITFGIVAYWVYVKVFNLVKDFKNPDHDEIEVLDL